MKPEKFNVIGLNVAMDINDSCRCHGLMVAISVYAAAFSLVLKDIHW